MEENTRISPRDTPSARLGICNRSRSCKARRELGHDQAERTRKISQIHRRRVFQTYVSSLMIGLHLLTEVAHCDGTYETPDGKERSYFTLHLYLNDAVGKDGKKQLEGGATTFFDGTLSQRIDVVPKVGRVLLFQHRFLIHSGDDVISGEKFTLRTDIMYMLENSSLAEGPEGYTTVAEGRA